MKTPAWQRSEGKNPKGGLNAKGRSSYNQETGGELKAPVKSGDNPRRASFLSRMGGMAGAEYTRMVNQQDCFFRSEHGGVPPRQTQR
jgi:hypothetical protein